MMEVGDRGLQNLGTNRKADKVFNPEIRGLFLPLAASGNGNISAPSNTAVADIAETMANTSSAIGSDTIRAPRTTDTETVASTVSTISREVDRLQAATQLSSLGDSLSSQADFDFPNLAGETQQVVDDQAGFDYMQPNLAGETQPADDQEGFDDMVVLQNDVVTATSVQPNGGFGAPYERFQESNAQLQESLGDAPHIPATASNNIGIAGMQASSRDGADALNNVIGMEDPDAPPLEPASVVAAEGPGEMVNVEEVHTMVEPPAAQIHGVEPSLVKETALGGAKAEEMTPLKDDRGTDEADPKSQGETTAEAKLFTSTEVPSVAIVANELPSYNAPVQLEGAAVNNGVSEQDVQAIKGRQVLKKFGRKSYQGDVVDYDSENKWFKVVYEDGDEEDLEFVEVKEILLPLGSSPKTSSAKKKRPHPEGGSDEQERNPKKRKDEKIETPKNKGRASRKGKGASSGKKRYVQSKKSSKKPKQAKSPGSKAKSLRKSIMTTKPTSEAGNTKSLQAQKKTDLETKPEEILDVSDIISRMQSQAKGGKRKRHSGTEASTSSNRGSSKKTSKAKMPFKSPAKKKAKTPRKSSAKKITGKAQTPAKSSSKKKGTRRRRSLSKLPGEGRENKKTLSKSRVKGSTTVEEIEEPKSKRLKTNASKEHDIFVGKPIKKDFGGTLYNGVVVKFDKKSKYYKVNYEDGDQEDLELEELEAILVSK